MKKWIALFCIAAISSGCITNDSSGTFARARSRQTSPTGFIITCVDGQRFCLDEAERVCPGGYDIASNTTNPQDYGRITMIIKCERTVE